MNGIVTVEAVDVDTNRKQKITVASTGNLTQEELSEKIENNGDYYLELATATMTKEVINHITHYLDQLSHLKPQIFAALSGSPQSNEQMEQLESLLAETQNYLKQEKLELEPLQKMETKLDTVLNTYKKLIEDQA